MLSPPHPGRREEGRAELGRAGGRGARQPIREASTAPSPATSAPGCGESLSGAHWGALLPWQDLIMPFHTS